ncbi:MAG: SMC-Scp complex subunit ScpB [Lachnospiraceae bacterium]|nr:SMC-Scp complex subunit ScpB [Lachnospiraceae bacterium]
MENMQENENNTPEKDNKLPINGKTPDSGHSVKEMMAAIEAILFTMGDSVAAADIAKALNTTVEDVWKVAALLKERCDRPESGLMIQRFEDSLQMCTKPAQYANLVKIASVPKKMTLSDSVIETLSIVAYKQPITKAEIETIRGVSCDYAINKLLEYDLIKELGRKDAPGRPILFGTTEQFLRSFGVKNLDELPSMNPARVEEFREEAEDEVDSRLGV